MKSTDSKFREVTAAQLQEGYVVIDGALVERRRYRVVCKTDRGTYIVVEPQEQEVE